jgi:hypothetical protein
MPRRTSLQVKLALYQLCHVLISCLISESPITVTNPRISGLKYLSRRTDHPSQPINRSFSLSGLSTPQKCQREDTNRNTDSHPAGTLDRKKQAAWRTRNPARNVLRERTVVEVVPTLKLIEAGAEVAIPTSMDFRQEFRLHEGPMP